MNGEQAREHDAVAETVERFSRSSCVCNSSGLTTVSIAPKDELEGMMAAQLLAAHNAAMECYRRAMIGELTFEGRRENLSQANKLSRTYAALLDVLNRHRGKGQQKVTVEHVHVHSGGRAVVGMVETPEGGSQAKSEEQPHSARTACGAICPASSKINNRRLPAG
jgi:hypothetical protein